MGKSFITKMETLKQSYFIKLDYSKKKCMMKIGKFINQCKLIINDLHLPPMSHRVKILACSASDKLANEIAYKYGQSIAEYERQSFSDGEFQISINETVRGCDVFIIQSTIPPADNLMEMLLMIDAKRASAHKIIAVIPYFGWARQDRKDKPRVAIGAKLVANMLFLQALIG